MSKLALLGGTPVRTEKFSPWPEYDEREEKYLLDTLRSRKWGGYPYPSELSVEFCERFAKYHGANHCVLAANGSLTLEVALKAAGIKAGDEVIVPNYTFAATAACAVRVNAVPVFVDVEERNYCINPDLVEQAITPKTKAIIPVHLGSSCADMDRIMEIARKHNLIVIEDCAHAHGGEWRGMGVGSIGDFGSFSFQSSKLMTAGEGGAITIKDDMHRQRAMALINCGRKEPGYDGFEGSVFGWNYRLGDVHVAILMGQMDRLDEVTKKRSVMADAFTKLLHENVKGLTVLATDPRVTRKHCYQTVMKYDSKFFKGVHRDRFIDALEAEGVGMHGDFYTALHEHELMDAKSSEFPMLRERYGDGLHSCKSGQFPVSIKAGYEEAVWMHYSYLSGTHKDLQDIVEAIAKIQANAEELLQK
jgi:dTDP-4-amino-4,6-dideoxygalactose transaminase